MSLLLLNETMAVVSVRDYDLSHPTDESYFYIQESKGIVICTRNALSTQHEDPGGSSKFRSGLRGSSFYNRRTKKRIWYKKVGFRKNGKPFLLKKGGGK